jgi:hypothetical protein
MCFLLPVEPIALIAARHSQIMAFGINISPKDLHILATTTRFSAVLERLPRAGEFAQFGGPMPSFP